MISSNGSCILWSYYKGIFSLFDSDLLSLECKLEEKTSVPTCLESAVVASIVLIEEVKTRMMIRYLQTLHHFMVYVPKDIPIMDEKVSSAGNAKAIEIMALGFAILPDEPNEERQVREQRLARWTNKEKRTPIELESFTRCLRVCELVEASRDPETIWSNYKKRDGGEGSEFSFLVNLLWRLGILPGA